MRRKIIKKIDKGEKKSKEEGWIMKRKNKLDKEKIEVKGKKKKKKGDRGKKEGEKMKWKWWKWWIEVGIEENNKGRIK